MSTDKLVEGVLANLQIYDATDDFMAKVTTTCLAVAEEMAAAGAEVDDDSPYADYYCLVISYRVQLVIDPKSDYERLTELFATGKNTLRCTLLKQN